MTTATTLGKRMNFDTSIFWTDPNARSPGEPDLSGFFART